MLVRSVIETFMLERPGTLECVEASIAQKAPHVADASLEELAVRLGQALGTGKLAKGPKSL